MKKHKALKVTLITLLICALLTWILPCATYQTEYTEVGRYQVGLFDLLSYQSTVFGYFGYIALFVLVVGGFYGVLFITGAYRRILDAICKKFRGKEAVFLVVVIALFAILTSFAGLNLALLMFFPFIISLVLMMGYDRITAVAVTAGSVAVGLMGSTFAYSTTQILQQYLAVEFTDLIWAKVILLVLGIALLAISVVKLGKKVNAKKESAKKEEAKSEFIPEVVKAKGKKRVWPLVVILDLIFIVMILGFISWSESFGIDLFTNVYTAVTEFELFGFPIFGKILGAVNPFGYWSLLELVTLMLLAIVILKFVYKIKWNDIFDAFGKGAKKALLPALIVIIIYTVLVLTTYDPYQLVIYKVILGLSKGFNIFTTGLVVILSSIFNGDPVYAFYSVLPYFVSVVTDTNYYPMIAVIFQSLYGIVTLVAPTSIPLMLTLAYTDVSYKEWFKYIWKLLVALIVVAFIIFTVLLLIV